MWCLRLVELSSHKTNFITLRAHLSGAVPPKWYPSNHSQFPAKFQGVVTTLLLIRQRNVQAGPPAEHGGGSPAKRAKLEPGAPSEASVGAAAAAASLSRV